ncbi:putative metalloprotease CJM1_0395 family protein [Congregibacter brevis]|uniref:Metalloprotease CJM1_0395 family protein n=1 Tax=Congregibacter brevis TaxID=3081201 RepID=A0ABZ0IJW9_9GAMM|nr:putative metalloprotease CJM1_0395 family protein [Congregibacter sp. IMCC45268]
MNIGASNFAPMTNVVRPTAISQDTRGIEGERSGSETRDRENQALGNNANTDRVSINGLSEQEQKQVRELADRDREVRAHEQAHASVGGRYASAPSYTYQRGPNGQQYAVAGEVSIDVSPVPNDPQATIEKARIVRRAALAPAQPSSQDRAVAAEATALEQQARAGLIAESKTRSKENSDPPDQESFAYYTPIDLQA